MATFTVERTADAPPINVEADRAEQEPNSTRVTFYKGDKAVGSFINVQAWYQSK